MDLDKVAVTIPHRQDPVVPPPFQDPEHVTWHEASLVVLDPPPYHHAASDVVAGQPVAITDGCSHSPSHLRRVSALLGSCASMSRTLQHEPCERPQLLAEHVPVSSEEVIAAIHDAQAFRLAGRVDELLDRLDACDLVPRSM